MFDKEISRREFIGKSILGGAALLSYGTVSRLGLASKGLRAIDPRVRIPNPFVNGLGQPRLVCVEGTDFSTMLTAGLAALGGLNLLITNNQTILIKPNLVTNDEPYPTISDLNSLLNIMTAVQGISTGPIRVGDVGSIYGGSYYSQVGFDPVVPDAGGELVYFHDTYDVRRTTWPGTMPDFKVFTDIYDSPIIINLCNMKRHNSAYFTCGMKNHVGTVSGPQLSNTRAYLHSQGWFTDSFQQTVAEIAGLVNSELTIVDARSIMTVTGPYVGVGGIVTPANKIILSGDFVAVDSYCRSIMAELDNTFDPDSIQPLLQRAVDLGLGVADLTQVEISEINTQSVPGKGDPAGPDGYILHPSYPNPFNASTCISFTLPTPGEVMLSVYDASGRKVTTLLNNWRNAGTYEVTFNAGGLASGNYLAMLKAGGFTRVQKLVMVK